jgi:hypothetical protein
MGKPPRKPSAAAAMLGLGGHHRIDPDVLRSRVQERERREASDDRTEVQRWLGDPPRSRSAFAVQLGMCANSGHRSYSTRKFR